jgi:hypothetical protein
MRGVVGNRFLATLEMTRQGAGHTLITKRRPETLVESSIWISLSPGERARVRAYQIVIYPLAPLIPAGAHHNMVHPFGGEKVHWTFSLSPLTSRRERVITAGISWNSK